MWMGDEASPCFGECNDNRKQNTSYQICKAQVLVFSKDTRISLVWRLCTLNHCCTTAFAHHPLQTDPSALSCSPAGSALTICPSFSSKSRQCVTAPSPFPSHCTVVDPLSKLSMVNFIQPRGWAGWEIWVSPTAASGEVRAGSIPSQDPHGLGYPLSTLSHDAQAVVWVNQAGD